MGPAMALDDVLLVDALTRDVGSHSSVGHVREPNMHVLGVEGRKMRADRRGESEKRRPVRLWTTSCFRL